MNNFETAIEEIQNFYLIDSSNFESEVFAILKKIINFNSGYIYFSNSKKYEYAYNPQVTKLNEIKGNYIVEDLLFKKTVLGKILITGNSFSDSDKKIFKTCAIIIANIIKDFELSKVIKMQIKALQEGYLEIKKSNKKIKSAEQSKTEFISHASHELRTPINSILGYSELLGEEFTGNLTPKQREFVNDIKISSLHLLGMVNETDLCYLGGFPAGKLKHVFGIWNEEIDSLYPDERGEVEMGGVKYPQKDYAEIIHLNGATALAKYTKDFYTDFPAYTVNAYGKGKAYYQAFRDTGDFADRAISEILEETGIHPALPCLPLQGVTAHKRYCGENEYLFVENYNAYAAENIALGEKRVDMLSQKTVDTIDLQPYSIVVLINKSILEEIR